MLYLGRLFLTLSLISSFFVASLINASTVEEKTEEIDTYKVALSALDFTGYEELSVNTQQANPDGFLELDLLISYTPIDLNAKNQSAHKFSFLFKGDHKDIPAEVRAQGVRLPLIYQTSTYSEPYRFKGKFSFQDKISAFDMLFDPQSGITIYHALTPYDLILKVTNGATITNGVPESHFGLIYTPDLTVIDAKAFDNAYGGVIAQKGMDLTTIDGITNGRGKKNMVPYPAPGTSGATITAPYYEPDDSYIHCDSYLQVWGKKITNNFSALSIGGNFTLHDGCELLFNRGGTIEINGSALIFANNIQIYQERDAVDYDLYTSNGDHVWGKALLDQSAEPVFHVKGDCEVHTETLQVMVPKDSPDPLFVEGKFAGTNKAGQPFQLIQHKYDQGPLIKYERPPVIVMPDLSGMISGFGLERNFGSLSLGSPSFASPSFTSCHDLRPSHNTSNHPLDFRTDVGDINVSINLGQFANQMLARATGTNEENIAQMMMAYAEQQSSHTPLTTIKDKYNSALNIADVGKGDFIFKGLGRLLGSGKKAPNTGSLSKASRNTAKEAAKEEVKEELVHETSRQARREAMRKADIPTSQQPIQQTHTPGVGRQQVYEVPRKNTALEKGPSPQTKIVTQQTTDRVPGHGPHWEAGPAKPETNRDPLNRLRHTNDKEKANYK